MKVTALIPDELVEEVKALSAGKNITDALTIALREWVAGKRIQALNDGIRKAPLTFRDGFSAETARNTNRRRR